MCKISEHKKKLIEKLPMKYGISSSMVLWLTRETTYSIACHIIPNVYLLVHKRPLLQNDMKPKRPKSTKRLQTRRPFASSQCFNRRNYKLNSGQRHLLRGEVSGPLHKVCLFCGAALVGARRVHILKTI